MHFSFCKTNSHVGWPILPVLILHPIKIDFLNIYVPPQTINSASYCGNFGAGPASYFEGTSWHCIFCCVNLLASLLPSTFSSNIFCLTPETCFILIQIIYEVLHNRVQAVQPKPSSGTFHAIGYRWCQSISATSPSLPVHFYWKRGRVKLYLLKYR